MCALRILLTSAQATYFFTTSRAALGLNGPIELLETVTCMVKSMNNALH